MAARENAEQKKPARREEHSEDQPTEPVASGSQSAQKEALDEDVDSILDEIDGVLEENAEDFVKSFVQKGGQ